MLLDMIILTAILAAILYFTNPPSASLETAGYWLIPEKKETKEWEKLLVFKKESGSAPPTDPAIGQAALQNIALGREWLSFAKDQFAVENERQGEIDDLTKQIGQEQLETAKRANEWSADDRARYEDKFRPLEDKFIDQAENWGSEASQRQAAAEARADVVKASESQRGTSQRNMARMGISPTSGRYAGVERTADVNTALAAAGAENTARNIRKKEGMALTSDAINMGRGLPSQAAGAAGLGLQAGNSAVGNYMNAANNSRANTQMMGQGYQGAIGANASGAGILNQQYNSQLQAWSAQQQAAGAGLSGIMGAVGTGLGAYAALSSKKMKTNKEKLKDGTALTAIKEMPIEKWNYKEGAQNPETGEVMDHTKTRVGAYAEDFAEKTGMGDGRTIDVVSALGVTMKAIQDLDQKVDKIAGGRANG